MAHPFFKANKYPSDRPEAIAFLNALSDAIQDPGQITLTYEQCGGKRALTPNQPRDVMWAEVLQNLTSEGLLEKLCDLIKPQFPNGVIMQQVIRDVVNAQSAKEVKIISDDVLVLDRVGLRKQLVQMEPDTSPIKVLLVRGGPKSGKSHGRYLFERFAVEQGARAVYLYAEILVTVKDVVRHLFSALNAKNEIPPNYTTDDAWYQEACVTLMEVAVNKNERLWIAVDDLGVGQDGAPLLDAEIRKFCERFALNMLNPMFRNRFRLMLIHYPDSIPTKWKHDFWTADQTTDADVKQKDVEEVLQTWSLIKDRTVVQDEITKLAAEVIAKAEAPVPAGQPAAPRLQRIHEELIAAINDLANK